VYAQTIAREQPARQEEAFELADLFAKQARRRAEDKFSQLFSNDDAAQYKTAQKLLGGRYAWFEDSVLDPAGDGPMIPAEAHTVPAKERFAADPQVGTPAVEEQAEAVQ
jgi:hypothetical protein